MKTLKKGDVIHIGRNGTNVDVWISSPTGDKSDSHIFVIPCATVEQAIAVQLSWYDTWNLPFFTEQ